MPLPLETGAREGARAGGRRRGASALPRRGDGRRQGEQGRRRYRRRRRRERSRRRHQEGGVRVRPPPPLRRDRRRGRGLPRVQPQVLHQLRPVLLQRAHRRSLVPHPALGARDRPPRQKRASPVVGRGVESEEGGRPEPRGHDERGHTQARPGLSRPPRAAAVQLRRVV